MLSMKRQTALIVPGFGEGNDNRYRSIASMFRQAGIKPLFVPISWPRTVLSQNAREFDETYQKYDPASTVVFGFSAGAMLAFMSAARRSPAVLILASMPAWFAEDLATRSAGHKRIVGHRRVSDYATLHFDELAKKVRSKTYLLVAEGEIKQWPTFLARAADAHAKIAGSILVKVPHSGHNIGHEDYLKAVKSIIDGLRPDAFP
jgi:pimeloyl-ACP methyl ester carboxylesterase